MIEVGQQLNKLGFTSAGQASLNWRTRRIYAAPSVTAKWPEGALEPACSPALLMWRDLLANGARPSPYQITRIAR